MQRHDLLLLTKTGEEEALKSIAKERLGIPAIVRMQKNEEPGEWEVGFSFPLFEAGQRVRIPTKVNEKEIIKVVSPFDWTDVSMDLLSEIWRLYVQKLKCLADQYGICMGIYGSLQLELITGLPYLHERSDIDIIIKAASYEQMKDFYEGVVSESLRCKIKSDVEIRIEGVGDIKAQELFSDQNTILVRGLRQLWLSNRKDIVKHIKNTK